MIKFDLDTYRLRFSLTPIKHGVTGLMLMISASVFSQSNKTMFFKAGFVQQSTFENRLTSNYRGGVGLNLELGFEKTSEKYVSRFSLDYSKANQGKSYISYSTIYKVDLKYENLKRIHTIKGLYIGGYIDVGTMINEKNGLWGSTNNPISFTQWASLGMVAQYSVKFKNDYLWNMSLSTPIVSYIIRPSYGSVWPDKFLEPQNFNLYERGIVTAGLKSGNVALFNNFSNTIIKTSMYFPFKNSQWHYGLEYSFNRIHTNEIKPLKQFANTISISFKRL